MLEKSPEAFRTISEAAKELGVEQHVLRFWETKFPQIQPLKRRGGRRFYRPEDMEILHKIEHLLYKEGYTIKGAKKVLSAKGGKEEAAVAPKPTPVIKTKKEPVLHTAQLDLLSEIANSELSEAQCKEMHTLLEQLQSMRERLKSVA